MKLRHILYTVCFVLTANALASAGVVVPPEEYRFPTEADYSGDWMEFRSTKPTPFHVTQDFNGDSLLDEAWILLARKGAGWALFVFLTPSTGKSPAVITLEMDSGKIPAQSMGIAPVSPGRYQTACGKGYWECKSGEAPVLNIRLAAIDFFAYESANSYFWWDTRTSRFIRTWMSD
jgi:hypothetical protein